MSSCCSSEETPEPELDPDSHEHSGCCGSKRRVDWVLWVSLTLVFISYLGHLFFEKHLPMQAVHFTSGVYELMNKMWWGLALGVIAVGALGRVPRTWVASILGKPGTLSGICRAMAAGLLLDLCNHGILLVAMKLYERGASYGQTLAFIIASPWNSLSMTLILLSLIGVKWTLLFILLSAVIAVITGLIVESMVKAGKIAANQNQEILPQGFNLWYEVKLSIRKTEWTLDKGVDILKSGLRESQMIMRWILLGAVMAAAIRAFVPLDFFGTWFGPTWLGVIVTLAAATVIEVCSEGSSPIAADLVTRAAAPGNGFAFLMAGAATDYTEIMALKETTKSWRMSLLLPLLTLPQVVIIAVILNAMGS
ncbi:MAG: permease [Akkermansiaceae bacterium]